MDLIYPFLFGLFFALAGGIIFLSDRALNWMYRSGIWKVATPLTETTDKRFRKAVGVAMFATGLILLVATLVLAPYF
jgi:hypothetical protein